MSASTEEVSPVDLIHCYPLSHPKLGDFRAFVSLAKHNFQVLSKFAGRRPPPIQEALGIMEKNMTKFLCEYPLHPCEENYLKTEPTMLAALTLFARLTREGRVARARNKIAPPSETTRFELASLARHLVFNWKISRPGDGESEAESPGETTDGESSEEDGPGNLSSFREIVKLYGSDTEETGLSEKEIDLIFRSSQNWLPGNSLEISENPMTPMSLFSIFSGYTRDVVIMLLRLLLTTCRNSHEYPNTLEISHDRLLLHTSLDLEIYPPPLIIAEQELTKNTEIIACAVSGIFVQILSAARAESPSAFSHISQLISGANGCLVFLKFLNGTDDVGLIPEISRDHAFQCAFPVPKPTAVYRSLVALYLICKNSPERTRKFLVAYKSSLILKRLFRVPSFRMQRIAFKLFRRQIRYFPRRAKIQNMRAISCVYASGVSDLLEDAMLSTAATAASDVDEAPTVQVHQSLESVAGQVEATEAAFEIRADPELPQKNEDLEISLLEAGVNWEDEGEISSFCAVTGLRKDQVFFGHESLEDFINSEIVGYRVIAGYKFPGYNFQ